MPETVMWGERGLVATFFMDLSADNALDRWKRFLAEIHFEADGPGLGWELLSDVWAVVEPGFGTRGFGSPDVAARFDFVNGTAAVLFLEAKMQTFAETTVDPVCRLDPEKFNSKLNGQLELNHRLGLAIENYRGTGRLGESAWIADTPYRDTTGKQRSVLEPGVLSQLVPRLRGPEVKHYLNVVVTSDPATPLASNLGGYLPEIFTAANGANVWSSERRRFGWIGWSTMKKQAGSWSSSQFLRSYDLNRHYIERDRESPSLDLDSLVGKWPPDRPQAGVAIVFLPGFDSDTKDTAVHLSWSGNSCMVRNYLNPGAQTDPSAPRPQRTLNILPLILTGKEKRFGRTRPQVTDGISWKRIIEDLNVAWGLRPSLSPDG